jgi:hypothetical protein
MAIVTDERPMATVPDEEVTDEECVGYARECVRLAAGGKMGLFNELAQRLPRHLCKPARKML